MMPREEEHPFEEYEHPQDAINAASRAAVGTGIPMVGVFFRQGHRKFIATSLPAAMLVEHVKAPKYKLRGKPYDVMKEHNRPLIKQHRDHIRDYLLKEEIYILPPILLNSTKPLRIFGIRDESGAPSRTCYFVLPNGESLYVTDGQHRIAGLQEALSVDEEKFRHDSVSVTIVEESDLAQTHQDFFDAAQVKAVPAAMLVEYDQRQAVNRMARYLCDEVPIFQGRIQMESNAISKGERQYLFTSNTIKRAVIAMFSAAKTHKPDHAARMIEAAPEVWRKRLVHYFSVFTEANPEWHAVAQLKASSGQHADLPAYRGEYLHFHASGLLAIAGVGEAILKLDGQSKDESLTHRQVKATERLAQLNWRRDNPIWQDAGILVDNLFVDKRGFNNKAIHVIKPVIGLVDMA